MPDVLYELGHSLPLRTFELVAGLFEQSQGTTENAFPFVGPSPTTDESSVRTFELVVAETERKPGNWVGVLEDVNDPLSCAKDLDLLTVE